MSSETIALLREQVARLERRHGAADSARWLVTGLPDVDTHLGGGLLRGAVHEFCSTGRGARIAASATRFVASILGQSSGQVVWLSGGHANLHGAGLHAAGLDPGRLICVEAEPDDVPGLAEDILRERGLPALVVELDAPLTLTASRRLQLAAEAGGVTGLLLHRGSAPAPEATLPPSASQTRWRVGPLPSVLPFSPTPRTPLQGPARWQIELLRQRGGRPELWPIEATDHDPSHPLRMAAPLADRSVAQAASGCPRLAARRAARA